MREGRTQLERRAAPEAGASMRARFDGLLARLLEKTVDVSKERLITLVVFGSGARGTATPESDAGVLPRATPLPRRRMNRIAELAEVKARLAPDLDRMAPEGIHTDLSPIFKIPEEVLAGSPLFLDAVFDVRVLSDRDRFFARFLANVAERPRRLGARRIVQGDRWYWPDSRPGEVFEL